MGLLLATKLGTYSGQKHTLDSAAGNIVLDSLGAAAIDLAADTVGGSQNFLHVTLEGLGEGLELHDTGDLDDLIEGYRLGVLDVLLLLAVSRGLLQGLNDQGGGGGNDGDSGLTVLDGELNGDTEALLLVEKKNLGQPAIPLPLRIRGFSIPSRQ